MAKGIALLVGLKNVDSSHYDGWTGENGCEGCELDVDNMNNLLIAEGFETTILKTESASHSNILQKLRSIVASLSNGDIFVFYYSGHGGQKADVDGDEEDGRDETLVAFDRVIIDDELNDVWITATEGSRIVMISDSCNSGTNFKLVNGSEFPTIIPSAPIQIIVNESVEDDMKAQLIHYGGCRDSYAAKGHSQGGAFTQALCKAWENGDFNGNYKELLEKARTLIGTGQIPQYNEYGPVSEEFRSSKPFQI